MQIHTSSSSPTSLNAATSVTWMLWPRAPTSPLSTTMSQLRGTWPTLGTKGMLAALALVQGLHDHVHLHVCVSFCLTLLFIHKLQFSNTMLRHISSAWSNLWPTQCASSGVYKYCLVAGLLKLLCRHTPFGWVQPDCLVACNHTSTSAQEGVSDSALHHRQ